MASYSAWPTDVKSDPDQYTPTAPMTAPRRTASADPQTTSFPPYSRFPQTQGDAQRRLQSRTSMRAHSSSTSSLSGAMGDMQIPLQPRTSVTPPSGLASASWNSSPTSSTISTSGFIPVSEDMAYLTPVNANSPSSAFGPYPYNVPMYGSPETSSGVPSPGYADQFFQQSRGQPSSAMVISPSGTPAPPRHSHSPEDKEEMIRRLTQRVRDLEFVLNSSQQRIRELETELSRGAYSGGPPSPLRTPQSSPTFNEEWRARTEARIKVFCSLNRAGNALCAWHDSRRERRAYPPRMAPPGYLNCGCTYAEALFEESLSRHGVGSYLPGENVRMDPALRNPLLKLLEERYGYRDGDFERDPCAGNWVEGEGSVVWEQKAASGVSYSRRNRLDTERR